jgi:hypothetical protein
MRHMIGMTLFVAWLLGMFLGLTVEVEVPHGVTVINPER